MHSPELPTIEINITRTGEFYRYLGLIAMASELDKKDGFLRQQIITELAESLDAEMGTHDFPIKLRVSGGRLLDMKSNDMSASARQWSNIQRYRAELDPNLRWFADIARIEAEEHEAVVDFAGNSSDGDTMLIASLFPEEAFNNPKTMSKVICEGFRPDIRRSFLRVYENQGGKIIEHVQSVDSSELILWNQVFKKYGLTPAVSTDEILRRRIRQTNKNGQELVEEIVTQYDQAISLKTGLQHYYGRPLSGTIEANKFVKKYQEIVDDTISELQSLEFLPLNQAEPRAEAIIYASKALLEIMYKNETAGLHNNLDSNNVRDYRYESGIAAAETGRVYYGCSGALTTTQDSPKSASLAINHLDSFSIKNGIELHHCITCPYCKRIVSARRDVRTGKWFCPHKGCKGHNETVERKLKKTNTKEKDFGDYLVELIFGSEEQRLADKIRRQQSRPKSPGL